MSFVDSLQFLQTSKGPLQRQRTKFDPALVDPMSQAGNIMRLDRHPGLAQHKFGIAGALRRHDIVGLAMHEQHRGAVGALRAQALRLSGPRRAPE
jgi:hypothetical protein